jgi:hypothetical protein
MTPPELLPEDCLEYGHPSAGPCSGPVLFHDISGRGRAFPRCNRHADDAYERHERSELARWAESDVAPDWFDPADAGERWEDDY